MLNSGDWLGRTKVCTCSLGGQVSMKRSLSLGLHLRRRETITESTLPSLSALLKIYWAKTTGHPLCCFRICPPQPTSKRRTNFEPVIWIYLCLVFQCTWWFLKIKKGNSVFDWSTKLSAKEKMTRKRKKNDINTHYRHNGPI